MSITNTEPPVSQRFSAFTAQFYPYPIDLHCWAIKSKVSPHVSRLPKWTRLTWRLFWNFVVEMVKTMSDIFFTSFVYDWWSYNLISVVFSFIFVLMNLLVFSWPWHLCKHTKIMLTMLGTGSYCFSRELRI